MKIKDIVDVFSKFFALYILCQILFDSLPSVIFGLFSGNINFQYIAPTVGILLCYLIVFMFFWFKSDWVAGKILGPNKDNIVDVNFNIENIEKSGFAIVGVFIVVSAIPQLASTLTSILISEEPLNRIYAGRSLESVFSIVVGLMLIFGASGISKIVKKVRSWPDL